MATALRHIMPPFAMIACATSITVTLLACAPVKSTKSKANAANAESQPIAPLAPQLLGGESKLSLPSWCVMAQNAEQVCFRCEREDAGVQIPYEQCVTPSESFQASRDCVFVSEQTNTISCAGAKSGEIFVMDVSLAREKIQAALPAFMIALDLSMRAKYPDRADLHALTSDLSSFLGSRMRQIINGEDLDRICGDLILLVNRHIKTPLTEAQSGFFRKTAMAGLLQVSKDLSGRKDYKLSTFIARGISIARAVPVELTGDARVLLTGAGMAEVLESERQKILDKTFSILSPGVLGVRSTDDLIRDISNLP